MLTGKEIIISVDQAEKLGADFGMKCYESADAETLLRRYKNGQYEAKAEFKDTHIVFTLIDEETGKKVPQIPYLKVDYNNELEQVMTISEAAEYFDIDVSTLRRNFSNKWKGFEQGGNIRKSAGTWLVTKEAMINAYGEKDAVEEIFKKVEEK